MIRYEKPGYSLLNLLDGFLNDKTVFDGRYTGPVSPKVDIVENEDHYLISAEVPGVDKKDISITVVDEVLTIKGEKKEEKKEKKESKEDKYFYYERCFGSFERSFILPENIDGKNIEAKYNNGILELTLKKVEVKKPESVEIKIL
jgi:HSP20 family protein